MKIICTKCNHNNEITIKRLFFHNSFKCSCCRNENDLYDQFLTKLLRMVFLTFVISIGVCVLNMLRGINFWLLFGMVMTSILVVALLTFPLFIKGIVAIRNLTCTKHAR